MLLFMLASSSLEEGLPEMAAIHISELLSWEEMKCDVDRVLCQDEFGPPTALTEQSLCATEALPRQGEGAEQR